jgi:NADPH:quinone reductase-like Zn-dependent oxidoreductase/1-acyl-sn-glycerol-3-phosphate acyltransferase/acyl carrier protein
VSTAVVDLTADLAAQGLAPGSQDLIVAANVVHATPDVDATLTRLRELLLPGGVLVLLEITRHPRWLDVIFGQTSGWWASTDTDLRPEHPLLEAAAWRERLGAVGFTDVRIPAEPGAVGEAAQSVIVAVAPGGTSTAAAQAPALPWLLLRDPARGGDLPDLVAAGLEDLGHAVLLGDRGAPAAALAAVGGTPAGVVDLLPSPQDGARDVAEAVIDRVDAGLHDALAVLQAALAEPHLRTCPVTIVTAGAMRLPDDPIAPIHPRAEEVLQAAVWGLGRAVIKEHPELGLRLVDVAAAPGPADVAALLTELTDPDADEEVAVRGSGRWVRRLRRIALDDLAPRAATTGAPLAWRAEIGTRGALGSIRLREHRAAEPGPGQVRIDVGAASLNFRDVMLAVGGIPGLEDELSFGHQHLGSDCAGVITAVGDGVTDLRPGDRVMGMAPGSLASSTTTDRRLVVAVPDGLSTAEAASIPTAFLTAWYALVHLSRLRRGERVLIHAGTGGVGLAAIQVARDAGAEIWATAGSEAKRAHLRELGIAHVMDSRSLAFADEVLAATDGVGVDVVLNALTGEAVERGIACLAPYGRFVEIGKLDIYTNRGLPLGGFRRNLSYLAVDLDRLCAERPALVGELLVEVTDAFAAGRLQPPARHDLPVAELEEALRLMARAEHIGKIVLSVGGEDADGSRPDLDVVGGIDRLLRPDGTYLVTGGLGGFGLVIAEHLASGRPGALVLAGRRAPSPAAAARIAAIRAAGVPVEVVAADVSRLADVDRLLARIDGDLPPLRGIVHGAMVLDDKPVEEVDGDSLDRVLAPKALGAWHLHQRTVDRELDLFVLCSSIASLLGNPLQASYGAASAVLDALAHHRRALGLPALTVNWGVLAGSGYVAERPELQRMLEQQGYPATPPARALAGLDTALERDVAQVMLADIDWRRLAVHDPHAAASPRIADLVPAADEGGSTVAVTGTIGALLATPPGERAAAAEGFVAGVLGRVLGIAAADVEADRPLDELGVDSLLAVELMTVLSDEVGLELPVIALLNGTTVQALAGMVVGDLADRADVADRADLGDGGAAPPPPPEPEAPAPAPVPREPVSPSSRAPRRTRHAGQGDADADAAPPPTGAAAAGDRWSPAQSFARRVSRVGFGALGRVDVDGLHHLPPAGPAILAVNHLSMADVPLALTVLPRRTTILATDELQRFVLLDWVVGRVGQANYVPRAGDPSEALGRALEVLAGGGVLALAPEGTRNRGGLGPARTGVSWLARASGLPVIPYAAWGHERWRDHVGRLRRMAISVRMGPPVPTPPADLPDAGLRGHTDAVMAALAALLPESHRGAYAGSGTPAPATPPEVTA